jgi:hypothetical protein
MRVGALREQRSHDLGVPVLGRRVERRELLVVSRVDAGAVVQKDGDAPWARSTSATAR